MSIEQQDHITRALDVGWDSDRLHFLYTLWGPVNEGMEVVKWMTEQTTRRVRVIVPLGDDTDWLGVFDEPDAVTFICVPDTDIMPPEVVGRSHLFMLRVDA